MDIKKIKELKIGSKLKINEIEYEVIDVNRGIKTSDEVKEWTLKDKEGIEYLLQMVLDKEPDFWKIEIDPLLKKLIFGEQNLIKIHSIEC